MEHVYKNPWHKPFSPIEYGPEYYTTYVKPVEYKGYLIYNRLSAVFDIVQNSICIHQCAGLGGAKRAIDKLSQLGEQNENYPL